jgi:hypothetical protein
MTNTVLAAAMGYSHSYSVISFCKGHKGPALAEGKIQTYRARATRAAHTAVERVME